MKINFFLSSRTIFFNMDGNPTSDVLMFGAETTQEVLKCAHMLVNVMAIPEEYWKRWTQSMYMLAVTFDIIQQLVHAGSPMVKSVSDISRLNPELLTNPSCLLLDPKQNGRPAELVQCAQPGEIQVGADGRSMYVKTESGKWLAIAEPSGKPMQIDDTMALQKKSGLLETRNSVENLAVNIADIAARAQPPASKLGTGYHVV